MSEDTDDKQGHGSDQSSPDSHGDDGKSKKTETTDQTDEQSWTLTALKDLSPDDLRKLIPRVDEVMNENFNYREERRQVSDDETKQLKQDQKYEELAKRFESDLVVSRDELKELQKQLSESQTQAMRADDLSKVIAERVKADLKDFTDDQIKLIKGPGWPKDDPIKQMQIINHFRENMPKSDDGKTPAKVPAGGQPGASEEGYKVKVTDKSPPALQSALKHGIIKKA